MSQRECEGATAGQPRRRELSRRQGMKLGFAGIAALAAGAGLSGCSTGSVQNGGASSTATGNGFPQTIKHAYGTTTIAAPATRPATIGWTSQDIAVGLGVVPVAMPRVKSGTNAHQATAWFDEAAGKLGAGYGSARYPKQYSDVDGADYTVLAQAAPDVILGLQSGISKEAYEKLSQIAPVVPFLKDSYNTPWDQSVLTIGAVLGKATEAERQAAELKERFATVVRDHPEFNKTVFINAALSAKDTSKFWLYGPNDPRSQFLEALGMTPSPSAYPASNSRKDYQVYFSTERALELHSDILVNWATADRTAESIFTDPVLGQMPALQKRALVNEEDTNINWAITSFSPLSIAYGLDAFLPDLVAAVRRAKA